MKYLQEEGSKSDEEDRTSSLETMEKTNVDLELWKESSENLFNNVLVKRKTAKPLFCEDDYNTKTWRKVCFKRGDKSQKKAKKWCDFCTCDDHIEGAEFSSVAKIADEDVKRFSRTKRRKDVVVIKRGHHKRMVTSEKNGAQEDAYLGEKWSISRLKSKPKTT
ncbi:hypothetical protein AtNW77_Chr2g0262071 [Arabidopsis thaliana]